MKTLQERELAAVMRATGKTRVEVLQAMLDAINRQPATVRESPKGQVAIKALEEAIRQQGG